MKTDQRSRSGASFIGGALLAPLLLGACQADAGEAPPPTDDGVTFHSEHHSYRVVPIVDGLQHPWAIAFLPEGDMLVTERGSAGDDGRPAALRIVRDGELLPEPVQGLPPVRVGGQGGLLDIALHPDFGTNRLLYLSYSKPNDDGSEGTTAVIRGRYEDGVLHDVEEIFEARAWSPGRGHHGSRLAFDRDGYLFVTVGDRQAPPRGDLTAHPAQDPTDHIGAILRLHDDGSVPSDNPFVDRDDALPEIWSYGHRNPQGLAVHPESNEVWSNEHGPQGGDELNLIRPGLNYGWPVVGFGVNYGAGTPIHEAVRAQGMENPVHHWTPSIATSGMMIYSGDAFPAWRGSIFNGGLAGQQLARVTVDEDGRYRSEEILVREMGRIRDVRQGPDGLIYLAIDHRGGGLTPIVRLEPAG
jgi:aldose sugar dehydrogenase